MNLYSVTTKPKETSTKSEPILATSHMKFELFTAFLKYITDLLILAGEFPDNSEKSVDNFIEKTCDIEISNDFCSAIDQFTCDIDEEIAKKILEIDTIEPKTIIAVANMFLLDPISCFKESTCEISLEI